MHTPEQASKLWCPMGRVGVMPDAGGPAGINDSTSSFSCNCIASGCAMWRWGDPAPSRRVFVSESQTAISEPVGEYTGDWPFVPYDPIDGEPACWLEPEDKAAARRRGFCGLAGRPEVTWR